jgi:uncharacterized membrane protein
MLHWTIGSHPLRVSSWTEELCATQTVGETLSWRSVMGSTYELKYTIEQFECVPEASKLVTLREVRG